MNEVYVPIKGYEDRYEVSNKGNIRTLKSRVNTLKIPKILNPEIVNKNYTKYARVQLSNPRQRISVHRLVAEHFLINTENKPIVNHKDNNGLNNSVENLEWVTQSENLQHSQNQGRLYKSQSKGGIVTSTNARIKALEKANSFIGTIFGTWKVTQNLGFLPVGKQGIKRIHFICECINCNNKYKVVKEYLLKKKPKKCNICQIQG